MVEFDKEKFKSSIRTRLNVNTAKSGRSEHARYL
jgi:hypothetical protein